MSTPSARIMPSTVHAPTDAAGKLMSKDEKQQENTETELGNGSGEANGRRAGSASASRPHSGEW